MKKSGKEILDMKEYMVQVQELNEYLYYFLHNKDARGKLQEMIFLTPEEVLDSMLSGCTAEIQD